MGETKIDRRRRYTLSVIREAFFALLAEVGFAKMTVADICRRAEINRGTFYLHYEDKYALLDALIDEALAAAPPLEGVESATLCQRSPADDDYRLLYSDSDAYARVAQRVIERGAEQMVPWVMEKTGLSREDAFLLFVHNVQGNLAVNRLLGWRRGPEFAHAQELLNAYSEGGLLAVSALRDSDNPSCSEAAAKTSLRVYRSALLATCPRRREQRAQIGLDRPCLASKLQRSRVARDVYAQQVRIRQLRGHAPERERDDARGHFAHAELQQQHAAIAALAHKTLVPSEALAPCRTLQKRVVAHPRRKLPAAVRASGDVLAANLEPRHAREHALDVGTRVEELVAAWLLALKVRKGNVFSTWVSTLVLRMK